MIRVNTLEKRIREANKCYYNDKGIISDEEYDALKDELKDLDATNILLTEVGAKVNESKEHWIKTKHLIPMGSQDKVNTILELEKWAKNRGIIKQFISIQEKLDGISISLNYKKGSLVSAVTRGNGFIGEDIFRNAKKMKGVIKTLKLDFTGSIRGEVVLYKEDWQKYMPELSNPRNAASGVARRITDDGQEHLTVICYDIVSNDLTIATEDQKLKFLNSLGFLTPNAWRDYISNVKTHYDAYEAGVRGSLPYEIDGFVIKLDDLLAQQALGNHGSDNLGNPKGQIALKFAHEMRETIIEAVTFEVGLTGRVTPVAWFRPIYISGANIIKASLHNITLMDNLNIGIGCTVLVSRRNDVIPYVEKVIKTGTEKVVPPINCPNCNSKLSKIGEYLQCNGDDCRIEGNIEKWVNHIEIEDVGPKLISVLVEHGLVVNPADLYTLNAKDISKLDRMGDKSAIKVVKNIQAKKKLPLYLFFGSLNIQNCGRRVFKNLIKSGIDSLEKIRAATPKQLNSVNGIGPQLAESIYNGVKKKSKAIDALLEAGVQIVSEELSTTTLDGKSFCFTGSMDKSRIELQKLVTAKGGEIKSVSRNLDFLVIADINSTSSKAKKARSVGVSLISEKEFLEMVNR